MRVLASIAVAVLLTGCATTPTPAPGAERDPLEGFNRAVWGFNQGLDKVAMKPVSSVYRTITPRPVRRGILRIFDNLSEPWSFVNNMLQGKPGRAMNNLGRFVVNTTIGVGGLADHATSLGIKRSPEDFGQTLAAWGVKSSTYLVLPLFGPSTIRDGVGTGVALFADPFHVCLRECTNLSQIERLAPDALYLVSVRADLTESGADTLLDTSLDSYATARSAFFQRRAAEIADQDGATSDASSSDVDAALKELNDESDAPPVPAPESSETPAPAAEPAAPEQPPVDQPTQLTAPTPQS